MIYLPKCPNCHRHLVGHRLTDFEGDKLIVCKICGARLRARISWLCAAMLFLLTVGLLYLWFYLGLFQHLWIFIIIWGLVLPFVQVRFTVLRRKIMVRY